MLFIAWLLGIPAIIFGVLGRRRADANPALGRRGLGTAGLILGIVTIVLTIVWAVLITVAVLDVNQSINDSFDSSTPVSRTRTTPSVISRTRPGPRYTRT